MFLKLILITVTSVLILCLLSKYFQDQRKRQTLIRIPTREEEEYWRMVQIAGPKYFEDVTKVYDGNGRELQ